MGGAHGFSGCFLLDSWVEIEEAMDLKWDASEKKTLGIFLNLDIGKILRLDIDF